MNQIEADVLVCGAGMAGTLAAVAAARFGAKTLLVERYGFLGGAATAAAVGQFVGWRTGAGRKVIGGLADSVVSRLREFGGSTGHSTFTMSTGHVMDRVEYDPEILKVVLDDLVSESGVQVLFHTSVVDVATEARRIGNVRTITRGGPLDIKPSFVVDSSGDLGVVAQAGARFLPLSEKSSLQPATMMFRFGPVDFDVFHAVPVDEIALLAERGVASGALARAALHASTIPGTHDAWFNISRLAIDATDPFALSAAEMEGRRQCLSASRFIAAHVPGCGEGRLVAFAPQVGVRETRRVEGEYVITEEDLRKPTVFADAIAWGAYPIDIHPAAGAGLKFETLGEDHAYSIPYRSLVPTNLDNALVAGRGISATHEAHAAVRVMPTGMAIGQAAGTAAAMVVKTRAPTSRDLSVATLRNSLRAAGAYLP